jgi:N-acetyl-anhydromuramyl-L-alanine amidase AmpD
MRRLLTPSAVEFIVVHCSGTTVHQDIQIQDILKRRQLEGYHDVGWHYVITRDGVPWIGAPLQQAGTHTSHFDDRSIGILLIGGKTTRGRTSDNFSVDQKEALFDVLDEVCPHFPNARIIGQGALLGGTSPHFDIGKSYDASRASPRPPTDRP